MRSGQSLTVLDGLDEIALVENVPVNGLLLEMSHDHDVIIYVEVSGDGVAQIHYGNSIRYNTIIDFRTLHVAILSALCEYAEQLIQERIV